MKYILILITFSNYSYSIGFDDNYLTLGNSRTEYTIGKGTGLDYLALDYATDNLPGDEGCQFDAVTAFSGSPGRAGLPNLPNGQPTWGGTLQRFDACNGNNTLIGDSWLGCLSYLSSPYWVISANDDPSFE